MHTGLLHKSLPPEKYLRVLTFEIQKKGKERNVSLKLKKVLIGAFI